MKKLLLLVIFTISANLIFAQYQGTPWYGTPWTFGEDSAANLSVGIGILTKNTYANGVPHSAYDVGVVDTLLRPSDDPTGQVVAGSGVPISSETDDDFRTTQAALDGVTLTQSDMDAIASPNFGAAFTSHQNRGITGKSGAWYRYSCNFSSEGNYSMVLRLWAHDDPDYAAWVRMYDKATMDPLYPWTRFHPGGGISDTEVKHGLTYLDVTAETFDTIINGKRSPNAQTWVELEGKFTLSGDVVVEFSDVGPSEAYGDNFRSNGSGNFGEFVFFYTGETADEFAPVAGPYMTSYDDMMDFALTLSENGTLYLVPAGTAVEDAATNNIDMMEMTTDDTYELDLTTLEHPDTLQLVTMDAAGNSRVSAKIAVEKAFSADKSQGTTGDTIFVNTTRSGYVVLVADNVAGERDAIDLEIALGNADSLNVDGGADTLVISTLTGDMDCNLYLVDVDNNEVSYAIPFQLGEGGGASSVQTNELQDIKVAVWHNEIIVQHEADYNAITVYDILGKQHIRESVNSRRISLDANGLREGVYIIRMTGNSGIATKKFLFSR